MSHTTEASIHLHHPKSSITSALYIVSPPGGCSQWCKEHLAALSMLGDLNVLEISE